MREIFVCSMLLMAGVDDLRRSKISNRIVLPAILFSLLYRMYQGGFLFTVRGINEMFIVCLIFLPVFKLRGIGAGDIKIFCMMAGFYNAIFALMVAALTIMLAGVIAIYRVFRNPFLLSRFLKLKYYLLYGVNGGEKYFDLDRSEKAEIIHMAPFTAVSYFLILLLGWT